MGCSGGTQEQCFSSWTVLSEKENRELAVIARQVVDDAVPRATARHRHGIGIGVGAS
jgi:hypothetical protein